MWQVMCGKGCVCLGVCVASDVCLGGVSRGVCGK